MTVRRIPAALAAWCAAMLMMASMPVQADDLQEATRLFRQGNHTQALERVNKYLAQRPRDAQARFLKGLVLTEQGRTADAIQVFSSLTEDYPELPEPYNNLAVLYASQGQYEKARYALERAIQTHPSYATAHENLGDIYARMASQAYDKALQLDRSNSAAETKLALIGDLFSGKGGATVARTEPRPAPSPDKPAQTTTARAPSPTTTPPAPTAASTVETKPPAPPPVTKPAAPPAAATPALTNPATAAAPVAAAGPAAAVPADTPKPDPRRDEAAIIDAANAWAAAWSAQNVPAYLAAYARDFRTPDGESRADWENTRKERVSKPKSISVTLKTPKVERLGDDRAKVTFRQEYRSDTLKSNAVKSLIMVRAGGKWLIQEEKVGR